MRPDKHAPDGQGVDGGGGSGPGTVRAGADGARDRCFHGPDGAELSGQRDGGRGFGAAHRAVLWTTRCCEGLRNNLGTILSEKQTAQMRGERLSQLQALLPEVDFKAQANVMQVDLAAEGLRIPGIPTIIGPFGYTDLRATLTWSLLDVPSLRNYLAARHNFNAAQLSAQDARDMVVLTVGNAYLLVLADEARGGELRVAGGDGEGFAGPGGGESRGRDGSAAG